MSVIKLYTKNKPKKTELKNLQTSRLFYFHCLFFGVYLCVRFLLEDLDLEEGWGDLLVLLLLLENLNEI